MLEIYSTFTLMVFSFVLAGIMTLIMLGVAENDIVDAFGLNMIPRIELRLLFIVMLYVIFLGILEGFTLYTNGMLISLDALPYLILVAYPKGDKDDHRGF
ncbi:hypothetical protein [Sulfuracidifex metallicus]|uniref:Uncharacterized protein n=2 Tax=Sulfuracidifex metallicus TaxID=47303 RepID=A0A6A9QQL2_SULME|nr:hypothetical protein [Sulfuracidifex metallicus]MUN29585.1 hypothetical protein [Sulfuracidifex metallicus DSM 6482 = JCM 9184]WOE49902.1 hypothetical protein RQ359_001394 [Sulfuracidifex metallicus DSM 6482 = JCM 9184]